MASPFGISFVPGAQPDNQNGLAGGRGGASRNPMQEAVKILSLRLPKFYGSGSIAPAPLLQAPGGMGQPGARGNVTAQALAQMAGLPPSMVMPPQAAPQIPEGVESGGTDTYKGWLDHEKGLGQPSGVPEPSFAPPSPHITPGVLKPIGPTPPGPPVPGEWTSGPPPGFPPMFPEPEPEPPPMSWPAPDQPLDLSNPSPTPTSGFSPWEKPGRNPDLARKFLEEIFGSQY